MDASVASHELQSELTHGQPPLVIDVRKSSDFHAAIDMIAGALRRDPERASSWAKELPRASTVVAYCAHGLSISQVVASKLTEVGIAARYLRGGIEDGWRPQGGDLMRKAGNASTRWVTRERPKIDRIACPWLIARFVDPDAEFLYVPASKVLSAARERDAVPYDVPDVPFSHEGEHCSFDAFLKAYRLTDPALQRLAVIVRGADTARLDLAPQAPGLAAISLGLSRNFADDHDMLKHGMVMYDALYAWCKEGQAEVHTWNPAAYR
jgi:rhodanese-related sulfurtransferase